MSTIRIPKVFYTDHIERDLPAPPIVKETKQHYFIDGADNADLQELYCDARYYSETYDLGGFCCEFGDYLSGVCRSAKATRDAIRKALTEAA